MKTTDNRNHDDALLDAVLRDETWQTSCAAFRREALGAFHAGQRRRRVMRWTCAALTVTALAFLLAHLPESSATKSEALANRQPQPPPANRSLKVDVLNEEELLSLFPRGSCFIAEIDGRKELIFSDPKVEAVYMANLKPPF